MSSKRISGQNQILVLFRYDIQYKICPDELTRTATPPVVHSSSKVTSRGTLSRLKRTRGVGLNISGREFHRI